MAAPSKTWKSFCELSDRDVWGELRTGNHQALEYLYRTYSKDLFNFGMKLYGRGAWVQDTLHELFVDLWRQHKNLSSVTSLKTYLFKALKYKLQRQYGKEKRWKSQGGYEMGLHITEVELPLESTLISAQIAIEQGVKIAKAMERLPIRQREALHLLFDEKMNYEQVAEVMEINVRSVYTLAWKGISSLKKDLKHSTLS